MHPHPHSEEMEHGARLRQQLGGTTGRTVDKRPYGKIWPNGNFSVGLGPVGQTALELEEEGTDDLARYGAAGPISEAVAALNSSNGTNPHTDDSGPRKNGVAGITSFGQQMLRSACYLLERDYGNADLCFATLTVPTLPQEGRVELARNWGILTNRLCQFLTRRLMKAGRPTKVVGCTEIQSARLANHAQAYLHVHAVWPSHSNAPGCLWAVHWNELRAWWKSALERYSGCRLPHEPRVELAPVRKSAERYMGKYLSKGSGESLQGFIDDLGVEAVPGQWWFITADLRSQVKRETAHGPNTGTLLYAVVSQALEEGDLGDFEWVRPVFLEFGEHSIHVGWRGRLAPWAREDCFALLAPLTLPPS